MKTIEQPALTVVGISARTTNRAEMQGNGEIPKLWARWMQQNLAASVPHRTETNLLAVYTDYESDENGAYTYVVGAQVNAAAEPSAKLELPEGMVAVNIPAGRYAVLTSAKGPIYEVVPAIWQRIWSLSPEQSGGQRAFRADFEVYDHRSSNPQDAEVEVHLGLK